MQLDVFLRHQDPREIPALAEAAEATGFDGIWFGETKHDALLACALAAERTSRVSVGTSIALAFSKSPMALAYTAWDVQALAEGRFILGLGSQVKGHMERRFGVAWLPPLPKMRETIQALRTIWRCWQEGEPLDFRGDHYALTLMTPFFDPGPIVHPEVPIYLAAVNEGMARLAGEVADGVHVHPLHTVQYVEEVLWPAVAAGAKRARRSPDGVAFHGAAFVATGRDEAEMAASREVVRQQVAFYASTRTYRPVLDLHGWGDLSGRLHALSLEGRWAEMGRDVPDDVLDAFAVEALFDDLAAALRARYAGVLDRVSLYLPFQAGEDWWTSFVASFRRA